MKMPFSNPLTKNQTYREITDGEEFGSSFEKRPEFRATYVHILFSVASLAIGLIIGYSLQPNLSTAALNATLDPFKSPIPLDVFTPKIAVPFVPDRRYVGSSHEVNENWHNLTKGSDAIWLESPQDYGLEKGIKAPLDVPHSLNDTSENFYVLSNLHQLHCINVIRRRYWHTLKNGYDPNAADSADWLMHVDHCFEYLRLSFTCGTFMVLEPDSPPGTPLALTVDGLGWGVTHQCINFERLLQYQEEQVQLYHQTR